MEGNKKDIVQIAATATAVIGTIVYCQYKYNKLEARLSEMEENQRVMAKYIKLLESKIAPIVNGVRQPASSHVNNQPKTRIPRPAPPQQESESSDEEEFSDTEEEEVKAPAPAPRQRNHQPHPQRRGRPRPSTPRPSMPVSKRDFERQERLAKPPSSAIRRTETKAAQDEAQRQARVAFNNPPEPKVVVITEEEEEEDIVINPVSMKRNGIFDDDLDGQAEDKDVKSKNRAAEMREKAKARARAIEERRKGGA